MKYNELKECGKDKRLLPLMEKHSSDILERIRQKQLKYAEELKAKADSRPLPVPEPLPTTMAVPVLTSTSSTSQKWNLEVKFSEPDAVAARSDKRMFDGDFARGTPEAKGNWNVFEFYGSGKAVPLEDGDAITMVKRGEEAPMISTQAKKAATTKKGKEAVGGKLQQKKARKAEKFRKAAGLQNKKGDTDDV